MRPLQDCIKSLIKIQNYSHIVLTSPVAARYFFYLVDVFDLSLEKKHFLAVGGATKKGIDARNLPVTTPSVATQEGMIDLIQNSPFFSYAWPKSSRARDKLEKELTLRNALIFDLYDTKTRSFNPPSLQGVKKVVFTSPSTVDAFFSFYPKALRCIEWISRGPITKEYLLSKFQKDSTLKPF